MNCCDNFLKWVFLMSIAHLYGVYGNNFFIDCGSTSNTTVGDRVFLKDNYASKYLLTPVNIMANTSSNTPLRVYQTARIFNEKSRYKFPLKQPGRYLVRFHFFPFTCQTYKLGTARFSVYAQSIVCFVDYTPPGKAIVKEYFLRVFSFSLEIIFSPSPNSVAFVNAIEVVLIPDSLFQESLLTTGVETFFRVNMGGPKISFNDDTLWRTWTPDDSYLEPDNHLVDVQNNAAVHYRSGLATRDDAPKAVYGTCRRLHVQYDYGKTFNVTWKFRVDPEFQYLVRFHYCDIVSQQTYRMFFNVFVNSWVVSHMLNFTNLTNGFWAAPFYVDFVTPVVHVENFDVSIGLVKANRNPGEAILNGLEIIKLNNLQFSLASVHDLRSFQIRSKNHVLVIVCGAVVGVCFFVLAIILFLYYRRRSKRLGQGDLETTNIPPALIEGTSNIKGSDNPNEIVTDMASESQFTYENIARATKTFDENCVVGRGGFGKVYKGVLADGTKVAIKRRYLESRQGLDEFQSEISVLSQCRHDNLVSLIGNYNDSNELILIYEYMENGTLKSHLCDAQDPGLSWNQRLMICKGAAMGLRHLHTGEKPVIHRDVKSTNILIDENLKAKLADFGISKFGPELDQTHVSTTVKGTTGYFDPEYFQTRKLTEKSDVYAFGVVMLEVLCGRPAIDETLSEGGGHLATWALEQKKQGKLQKIIDPRLQGEIKKKSLQSYWKAVEKSLAKSAVDRPSMIDVERRLNEALKFQNADDHVTSVQNCKFSLNCIKDAAVESSRFFTA